MKYNKKILSKVYRLIYDNGITKNKRLIEHLDITKDTFYEWKSKHSEFAEIIEQAKQDYINEHSLDVEHALLKRALGYEVIETIKHGDNIIERNKHIPPNISAIKYFLNNKFSNKWQDKQNADETSKFDIAIELIKERNKMIKESIDNGDF